MTDEININNMSDEEFNKMMEDQELNTPSDTDNSTVTQEPSEEVTTTTGTETQQVTAQVQDKQEVNQNTNSTSEPPTPTVSTVINTADNTSPLGSTTESPTTQEQTSQPTTEEFDYKSAYEKITQPFKANGVFMQVKTPEEAISLMQMGANYTKKTQELATYRHTIELLKRNGINPTDTNSLGFLIDLKNHNVDAIKRLIKESNIDVYSLNDSGEDNTNEPYTPKTVKQVSEADINYTSALNDLQADQSGFGSRIISDMQTFWDKESIALAYAYPDILNHLRVQREAGVYDNIVNEVNRRKILGQIPQNASFLSSYISVAKELYSNIQPQENQQQIQQPYVQQPQTPQQDINNTAKHMARTRNISSGNIQNNNNISSDDLYKLSDEDFINKYGNYLN